jgi:hypothetical protein
MFVKQSALVMDKLSKIDLKVKSNNSIRNIYIYIYGRSESFTYF